MAESQILSEIDGLIFTFQREHVLAVPSSTDTTNNDQKVDINPPVSMQDDASAAKPFLGHIPSNIPDNEDQKDDQKKNTEFSGAAPRLLECQDFEQLRKLIYRSVMLTFRDHEFAADFTNSFAKNLYVKGWSSPEKIYHDLNKGVDNSIVLSDAILPQITDSPKYIPREDFRRVLRMSLLGMSLLPQYMLNDRRNRSASQNMYDDPDDQPELDVGGKKDRELIKTDEYLQRMQEQNGAAIEEKREPERHVRQPWMIAGFQNLTPASRVLVFLAWMPFMVIHDHNEEDAGFLHDYFFQIERWGAFLDREDDPSDPDDPDYDENTVLDNLQRDVRDFDASWTKEYLKDQISPEQLQKLMEDLKKILQQLKEAEENGDLEKYTRVKSDK